MRLSQFYDPGRVFERLTQVDSIYCCLNIFKKDVFFLSNYVFTSDLDFFGLAKLTK